jgi:hypothetical protein
MTPDESKKRRHERHTFTHAIEYVSDSESTEEVLRVSRGYAINISESGLCFASADIIREGQKIRISSSLPVPYQTGIVVWSSMIDDTLYKAGLEFV